MIQIETIQPFRTLQVLNGNKKEKTTNFTLFILLQAWVFIPENPYSEFSGGGRRITRSLWYGTYGIYDSGHG